MTQAQRDAYEFSVQNDPMITSDEAREEMIERYMSRLDSEGCEVQCTSQECFVNPDLSVDYRRIRIDGETCIYEA